MFKMISVMGIILRVCVLGCPPNPPPPRRPLKAPAGTVSRQTREPMVEGGLKVTWLTVKETIPTPHYCKTKYSQITCFGTGGAFPARIVCNTTSQALQRPQRLHDMLYPSALSH